MTLTSTSAPTSGLRTLPPEPWGRRMKRAREDVAGLSLIEAATLAGHWMLTSDATICRLEGLDAMPVGPRSGSRRQLAYVLCLAYEVDPAELGLTPDDLPPNLVIPPRTPGDQVVSPTKWYAQSRSEAADTNRGGNPRPLRKVA